MPIPILPQDVVIIEDVSSEFDDVWHPVRLQTLRNCALVCKSFYYPSREHLYAHIDFFADSYGQERAANIVKVLEHEYTRDLVPRIRSVKLRDGPAIFAPMESSSELSSSKITRMYRKTKECIMRLVKPARDAGLPIEMDHIQRLLHVLGSAPVQRFVYEGNMETLSFGVTIDSYTSIIAEMRSKPSLTSLSLSNIYDLDQGFLTTNFPSSNLRELELSHVSWRLSNALPLAECNNALENLAKIETLKLGHLNYSTFFLMVVMYQTHQLPPQSRPYVSPLANVRTLSISLSTTDYSAMDTVWRFTCGLGKTLENLELRNNTSPGGDLGYYEPYTQSYLSGLRTLKLSACAMDTTLDLNYQVTPFVEFLVSPKTPLKVLESITLELFLSMNIQQRDQGITFAHAMLQQPPHPIWYALDSALTKSTFVRLKTIALYIRPFYFDPDLAAMHLKNEDGDFEPARYFPRLMDHPSIKVTTMVEAIYSPKNILSYLRSY